ncbi:MAG: rhomboid family intramembrane serine protease [Candidatus Bathyarchaeia archaeon]
MEFKFKKSLGIPMGGVAITPKKPWITMCIIALNIAVYAVTSYANFFLEVSDYWVSYGGFFPSLIATPFQWYRIFTSMFLHADFFHILFNMYFLYIFGKTVENTLGKLRYLTLYIVSGIAASIFHTAFSFLGGLSSYIIPAIGASGAISGVLGAYLLLYPGTSLAMGWFFLFFPVFFRLKASYFLIFWFATQLIYGYARMAEGTAVFAHAGGFLAGIALLLLADKTRIQQLKTALRYGFSYGPHLTFTFTYPKTGGLSRTSKIIVSALTASLLVGAVFASAFLQDQGNIKAVNAQYTFEGTPYIDYVGIKLPEVASYIAQISQDSTRVLMNRLYAAGLIYNETYAGEEVNISGWNAELNVTVTVDEYSTEVPASTTVDFVGKYDGDGFLVYGEGNLTTQVVQFQILNGRLYIYLSEPVTYNFKLDSQTVNLTWITRCAGVPSLATAAVALAIIVWKDEEFAVVGEVYKSTGYPFEPLV